MVEVEMKMLGWVVY